MRPAPREPTGISPRVDCVFRALLADPDHTDRLIAFLSWHVGESTQTRRRRSIW